MTDEKWTPGPWQMSRCPTDAEFRVVTTSTGASRSTVASTGQIGTGIGAAFEFDEEAKANAHLIAAAPDLYRELKHCVARLEMAASDARGRGDREYAYGFDRLVARATAALTKAKGK